MIASRWDYCPGHTFWGRDQHLLEAYWTKTKHTEYYYNLEKQTDQSSWDSKGLIAPVLVADASFCWVLGRGSARALHNITDVVVLLKKYRCCCCCMLLEAWIESSGFSFIIKVYSKLSLCIVFLDVPWRPLIFLNYSCYTRDAFLIFL